MWRVSPSCWNQMSPIFKYSNCIRNGIFYQSVFEYWYFFPFYVEYTAEPPISLRNHKISSRFLLICFGVFFFLSPEKSLHTYLLTYMYVYIFFKIYWCCYFYCFNIPYIISYLRNVIIGPFSGILNTLVQPMANVLRWRRESGSKTWFRQWHTRGSPLEMNNIYDN